MEVPFVFENNDEGRWKLNDTLFNPQDSSSAPINLSLDALKALHAKWVYLLKGLSKDELNAYFIHPEGNEKVTLKENIGIYAWHCNHHFAHTEQLLIRKEWI